jgi:porphobilinogen synthase
MSVFPAYRPRRLRRTQTLRRMVQETRLSVDDFIYPLFVLHGQGVKREISSMPGNYHFSLDMLPAEAEEIARLGIPAVILFGLPEIKDCYGTEDYAEKGIVQEAVRAIKKATPDLVVVTDICMCEYTDHGHCGIVKGCGERTPGKGLPQGYVINDETLEFLGKIAVSHAEAGVDIVAPSGMMDGQIQAIRQALDAEGYESLAIMAYSAKYASAFYGPFREAADSPPQFGDRRAYQMAPHNVREALRETALDINEGADIVMVKPALAYLDVIRQVRDTFDYPIAAYNVSGEFSMVKAAARLGWIDERAIALEILNGIKRAGADMIINYFAKDAARWLAEQ